MKTIPFEPERFEPCALCGELLEVGRKKEGIWHRDDQSEPALYHKECLAKIVNLYEG